MFLCRGVWLVWIPGSSCYVWLLGLASSEMFLFFFPNVTLARDPYLAPVSFVPSCVSFLPFFLLLSLVAVVVPSSLFFCFFSCGVMCVV